MPDFTLGAAMMMGIGVGVDYALFIVTRYREALRAGHDPETATVVAIDTAGRAVHFAGMTVVIAVLGLLVMDLGSVNGVAVAIAASVLMTMLAAMANSMTDGTSAIPPRADALMHRGKDTT